MSITHALKWSFLSEIAAKAIQPLVFVVLARLLTPDDYGVVAAAAMVISFSQVFWEAGMGKTIIQYQGDRAAAASVAFWINNALGVVVAGVLVAISGWVADRVFHDPRVALVLQVMALQVFLSALAAVHMALLQKDMQFKHLFWVRLATVAVPGLASIPLAWYGMGYWALVAGALVGQTVQVAILWKTSPWKPRFKFDAAVAKQLASFGGWVVMTGFLGWIFLWIDSVFLAYRLNSFDLGLYRVGSQIVAIMFGMFFSSFVVVLYSHFSSKNIKTVTEVKNIVADRWYLSFLISAMLAAVLITISALFLDNMLGAQWRGVTSVVSMLAIANVLSWGISPINELLRASSRADYETKQMALMLPIILILYWFSLDYGLDGLLYAKIVASILSLCTHLILLKRFGVL